MKRFQAEVWYAIKRRIDIKKKKKMKRFKVEGWYRLHDEKDFEILHIEAKDAEKAIKIFQKEYRSTSFYKIDIIEL